MYKTLVNDTKREAYTRYGDLIKGRKVARQAGGDEPLRRVVRGHHEHRLGAVRHVRHHDRARPERPQPHAAALRALLLRPRRVPATGARLDHLYERRANPQGLHRLRAHRRTFRPEPRSLARRSCVRSGSSSSTTRPSCTPKPTSNMAMIEHLDTYLVHVSRVLTSHIPVVNSEVAWRGVPSVAAEYEKVWEQAVAKASAASGFTHKALIEKVCGRKQTNNIRWLRWNGATLQRMLRQVDNLFENGIGYGTIAVYLVLGFFWFMM
ncbi:phosphate starvation-inducible protein PhoH [Babesia caballi]|uniref:Phosphate starvation-inducible protein PhoH n=1 Tax=Babesia caballi TaxID=5871 RepID=A0AAV4LLS7_BABCB|nr:phosphate starvation-inducible protein PhoH [Babesia caballi]